MLWWVGHWCGWFDPSRLITDPTNDIHYTHTHARAHTDHDPAHATTTTTGDKQLDGEIDGGAPAEEALRPSEEGEGQIGVPGLEDPIFEQVCV